MKATAIYLVALDARQTGFDGEMMKFEVTEEGRIAESDDDLVVKLLGGSPMQRVCLRSGLFLSDGLELSLESTDPPNAVDAAGRPMVPIARHRVVCKENYFFPKGFFSRSRWLVERALDCYRSGRFVEEKLGEIPEEVVSIIAPTKEEIISYLKVSQPDCEEKPAMIEKVFANYRENAELRKKSYVASLMEEYARKGEMKKRLIEFEFYQGHRDEFHEYLKAKEAAQASNP